MTIGPLTLFERRVIGLDQHEVGPHIPDEAWDALMSGDPEFAGGGGILCVVCAGRRLTRLGVKKTQFRFTSGPFSA